MIEDRPDNIPGLVSPWIAYTKKLEAENEKLRVLVHEVTCWHRDRESPDYNDCGTPETDCVWCANAKAALENDDG
jgi:hypothetical protein